MTTSLLRIGPFSRASSLSIKALRAYHEQGLLVPALVDPDTGYRVYAADQLFDAAVLRRLRDLDVPLRLVREVLEARDPQVTERVLAEHARTMQARLDETVRIIDELQRGIDRPELHTPVHGRHEPAQHALVCHDRVAVADFGAFLVDAFGRLVDLAARVGAEVIDVPGGLYPQQIDDDDAEDVTAYLPIAAPVAVGATTSGSGEPRTSSPRPGEVPAAHVAVALHLGGYDTIGHTYRLLGRWVATRSAVADGPVREAYLVSPPAPDHELRTEVRWPVLPDA